MIWKTLYQWYILGLGTNSENVFCPLPVAYCSNGRIYMYLQVVKKCQYFHFSDSTRKNCCPVFAFDFHIDGPQAPSSGWSQCPTPSTSPHHSCEWRCSVWQTREQAQNTSNAPEISHIWYPSYTEGIQSVCTNSRTWYYFCIFVPKGWSLRAVYVCWILDCCRKC